jgi:hypothetical protein
MSGIAIAEPGNLMSVHLRRMSEQMESLCEDDREIKTWLGILEQRSACSSNRIDRIQPCLDRIESRSDIFEA